MVKMQSNFSKDLLQIRLHIVALAFILIGLQRTGHFSVLWDFQLVSRAIRMNGHIDHLPFWVDLSGQKGIDSMSILKGQFSLNLRMVLRCHGE